MQTKKTRFITSTTLMLVLSGVPLLAVGTTSALAENRGDATSNVSTSTTSSEDSSVTVTHDGTKLTTTTTSSQDSSAPETHDGTKLTTAKHRVCENRHKAIDNTLSRIVSRGQNQLELFSKIADRVETYKTTKNLTVTNYDQLVATIAADKTQVTNDLAAMKVKDTIDCNSDPKGTVNLFQTQLQQEIKDLKTYKTDVKNLITAVKTAADTGTDKTTGGN